MVWSEICKFLYQTIYALHLLWVHAPKVLLILKVRLVGLILVFHCIIIDMYIRVQKKRT